MAAQNIKYAFPKLGDKTSVPEYIAKHKIHAGPFLWIAREGHYEYTHFDPDEGCLMIVQGEKQVRLISNEFLEEFKPNVIGSMGRTVQSSLELENLSNEELVNLKNVVSYNSVIKPGEMLYIPALWWHQVSALSDGVSVNIFWGEGGDYNFTDKVLKHPTFSATRYWILNVIEQNRSQQSFGRMLARLDEVILNFLLKQWHEKLQPTHLTIIRNFILDYLQISVLPEIEENPPKHPPLLKIRGLLHRDRGQGVKKSPKIKQKQRRSKEENLEILERKKQKLQNTESY